MSEWNLKGQRGTGWAILNHLGSPWGFQTWATKQEAEEHLDRQRDLYAKEQWGDLSHHSVQYVKVTISPITQAAAMTQAQEED